MSNVKLKILFLFSISELWNKFVESCLACYRPNENITVDEQLYPTKCRCSFLQYMTNKPRDGENIVKHLVEPFLNKGRNVAMDNFFTSVILGKDNRKKRSGRYAQL